MKYKSLSSFFLISTFVLFASMIYGKSLSQLPTIKSAERAILRNLLKRKNGFFTQIDNLNIHKQDAVVSEYKKLLEEEEEHITARKRFTARTINDLFDNNDVDVPIKIGLCESGGGYRAMTATFGFLEGLRETNLLDTALYMSSLSGSTWATSAWIYSQIDGLKELTHVADSVGKNISSKFRIGPKGHKGLPSITTSNQKNNFLRNMEAKWAYNQSLSIVDYYGALVLNDILNGTAERLLLRQSEQQFFAESGLFPFPIYTSVSRTERGYGKKTQSKLDDYDWYDFTPYSVGSKTVPTLFGLQGISIPIWSFGRDFKIKNNEIVSVPGYYPPEMPGSSLLGIYGSAFNIDLNFIGITEFNTEKKSKVVSWFTKNIINKLIGSVNYKRPLTPMKVRNFVNPDHKEPVKKLNPVLKKLFKQQKKLSFVDAGIKYNLPLEALINRDTEIIIIMDASADTDEDETKEYGKALVDAQAYMKQKGFKFPQIPSQEYLYKRIKNGTKMFQFPEDLSDWRSVEQDGPILIYFHIAASEHVREGMKGGYCDTFNFGYSLEDYNRLRNTTKEMVTSHKMDIVNAIKDVYDIKRGITPKKKYPGNFNI